MSRVSRRVKHEIGAGRCRQLLRYGVTHILNVAEAPSLPEVVQAGFQCVADVPIVDLRRISDAVAIRCIDCMYEALIAPGSRFYVHCTAGQNRSPTVVWLYLVACGVSTEAAADRIVKRSPDAIPGHGNLVDAALIEVVRCHAMSRGMTEATDLAMDSE